MGSLIGGFGVVAKKDYDFRPDQGQIRLVSLRRIAKLCVPSEEASVAQLAEQRFCKPPVVGSNPSAGS